MPEVIAIPGAIGWLQDDAEDAQTVPIPAAAGWVQTEANTPAPSGPVIVVMCVIT